MYLECCGLTLIVLHPVYACMIHKCASVLLVKCIFPFVCWSPTPHHLDKAWQQDDFAESNPCYEDARVLSKWFVGSGSGWAWLVVKADGSLAITSTPNQDNPLQVCQTIYPLINSPLKTCSIMAGLEWPCICQASTVVLKLDPVANISHNRKNNQKMKS